jgi:hypothetical protein
VPYNCIELLAFFGVSGRTRKAIPKCQAITIPISFLDALTQKSRPEIVTSQEHSPGSAVALFYQIPGLPSI